ncbi:integral membrane sensor signal transduction histidine kinase [Desulforamulus reducens MI-1]|uniref:histidine kinase n=1 Tax=Desulforamulus reducens (strain ATCC BAA-1160 / DSM 100696 / MI-1) TaxID=349161 RepID=A4J5S0_DESRM|nr:ATP-binding protein [Desulforamulus reducens]ABO50423.1 integral membrane sensor signal transduction histidine kinase [Desulforamulus reducens MI-1]
MIGGSIVKKLWLATSLLVLLAMGASTLTQMWLLKSTYYDQQIEQLLEATRKLAVKIQIDEPMAVAQEMEYLADNLQGATAFLVNRDGQIIYKTRGGWSRGPKHQMGMHGNGYGMYGILTGLNMKDILAGKEIIFKGHHPMFGVDVITVAVPVKKEEIIGEVLVLSTPRQAIDTNIKALQSMSVYSLLFGLVLATLFSWLLSRSLSRPLLKMKDVANAMSRGDYSRSINIKSKDEIGMLADSLNTLSHDLEEKINQLRRIDDTRRDFVAGVSHELRTPLTIIQGNAEALLDGVIEDKDKQRDFLINIYEESLRLKRLSNELLDMRKIETGQVNLYKEKVNASEIFFNVVSRMQHLAKQRGIILNLSVPEQPVILYLDTDRLGQVLINLIDNALRFSRSEVTIELKDFPDKIKVQISDNGPGIPEAERNLVWDKFYKVDKSRSRSAGGTGLGLSIVKQLIELHGGTVCLTSREGEGTTFIFTIPKEQGGKSTGQN